MYAAILDTDILSEILKQRNPIVCQRAVKYLQEYGHFSISIVSRFEILRGYKEQNATTQLARFATFCQHTNILSATDVIFDRAAELWAFARQHGHPYGDADLLIAATALENNRVLVSGNTSHFIWIPQLKLEDWRQP
jgi:tRNA(fMet)-specific endonuclease VapC